ncbi:MAG: EamA family transporter RarD [Pseudomonadales bacterium]|nr:EamA family transporter RarD [Pseudomonadales bacterium]MBO6566080.1 EamA family transporter RarD [Pseudomonadales bacterium]MBO6594525.1 EamA family transporter RarD [Pseudomonadales bacterium]MBO6821914.1 EamA family transporter RarD [Pseudomonadales bacterium]
MNSDNTRQGVYYALTAYIFWGVVPIYFKWVDHVSPWEILSHRVIWALILLLAILFWTKQLSELRVPLKWIPKLLVTSVLLAINWLVFIYAVVNNNIAETALGYFINPLVSVFLGVVILREYLRPLQWIAVAIAALGILGQLIMFGRVPWIALALAFSFGFYGLLRKNLGLHAIGGLAIETLLVVPFALAFLIWTGWQEKLAFGDHMPTDLLLMLGGFVTSFPLLCFAAAVKRLSLTTLGMFQYVAPSISLVLAIFVYHEDFDPGRAITFICIWIALAIFTFEAWAQHRRRPV